MSERKGVSDIGVVLEHAGKLKENDGPVWGGITLWKALSVARPRKGLWAVVGSILSVGLVAWWKLRT